MRAALLAATLLVVGIVGLGGRQPDAFEVTFEGQVLDEAGAAVAGADVRVVGQGVDVATKTGADGRFRIRTQVRPGSFRVVAVLPGVNTGSRRVRVFSGQADASIDATVRLGQSDAQAAPAPPPPPPPPPETASPPPDRESDSIVTVYYATDRARGAGPTLMFANTRSETGRLELGHFEVSIPRDHRLANVERPTWRTLWREDPARHFVILSRSLDSYTGFYSSIAGEVNASRKKEVLVFIHGFNVQFDDAIYRTAQITYDLGFDGPPILYSWPSEGGVQNYVHDNTTNELTIPHLRWFLEDVVARSGATTVHVIAHSMGNRALTHALSRMADGGGRLPRLSRVVLTAPDIDADVFRDLADGVKRAAAQVTLYASSGDLALIASKQANGFRRAGDASPLTIVPGIDTVDASALTTDFLGHSYYGDHASVIADIRCLLSGTTPERRYGLSRLADGPRVFWRFVKDIGQMACMVGQTCACGLPG